MRGLEGRTYPVDIRYLKPGQMDSRGPGMGFGCGCVRALRKTGRPR